MNFTYDLFNRIEAIQIILCKNNLEKVGVLGLAYDKKAILRLTDFSEISFTYPQKVDNKTTQYYNDIKTKKIIYVPELGYFRLEKVKIESDGIREVKNCVGYSIQIELKNKQLVNFSGTYKLYDSLKPQESLMGILIDYFPNWSINEVDENLWNIYRTYDISEKDIYSFLMDDLMTSFNCVVLFDIMNRKISVKELGNVSKETDIYISFDNLIKSAEIEELSDEICSSLRVRGGSESTDIRSVNPNGTDTIYNINYYKTLEYMSQSLIDALNAYEIKYNSNKTTYSTKLTQIKDKNTILITKNGELDTLNTQMDVLVATKMVKIQGGLSLTEINSQISSKQSEINTKNNEITGIKNEIAVLQSNLNDIVVQLKFSNNFTVDQLKELDNFLIESTYTDSTFIVVDSMTEVQKQEKMQELYDYASTILTRLSQPRFSFSISSANFVFLKEYESFMKQLELGCLIKTELREDYIVTPILLEIEIDFEQDDNFNLRFGNRYKLSDNTFTLADIMSQTTQSSSTISFEKYTYKDWYKNSKDSVSTFIESALNASVNNIKSSDNQDILIDQHGMRCRQFDTSTNAFKPEQLWIVNNMISMSNDGFSNTGKIAIGKIIDDRYGEIWGIAAPLLAGKILTGNNLRIENSKNSFVLDENGCVLTDAKFTLQTSNGKGKIILDPTLGIRIQGNTGGTFVDKFYVDSLGNVKFSGELSAATGTFSGTVQAGSIISSTITGGTISIGSNFSVNSSGIITATGANISGNITANALTANATIQSPIVTGGTIKTSSSGQRIELSSNKLQAFDSNGISRIKFEPVTTSEVNYYELQFQGQSGSQQGSISGTDNQLNIVGHNALVLNGGNDKVYFTSDVDFQGNIAYINTIEPDVALAINGILGHTGSRIGFFGVDPAIQQTASLLGDKFTTETADLTYGSIEVSMLTHLKSDVGNLYNKVNGILTKLAEYGLFELE